jgi:hypothetical protein
MLLSLTITVLRLILFKGYLVAKIYLRSKSSARRGNHQLRYPTPAERLPWILLGAVTVIAYGFTQFIHFSHRGSLYRTQTGATERPAWLPERRKISDRQTFPENTSRVFRVKGNSRLVISWRNPKQCDQEIVLQYRQSPSTDLVLSEAVLVGQSGNKIFPKVGDTQWHVQWIARPKATNEASCVNANYGAMPPKAEVRGFTEFAR